MVAGWQTDGVAMTTGGRLQCQKIFHLYAGKSPDVNAWKAVIGRCFSEADRAGLKSLALPPVGTGTVCLYSHNSVNVQSCRQVITLCIMINFILNLIYCHAMSDVEIIKSKTRSRL